MSEYDEADEQLWGEAPPRDGVDRYAREVDPFFHPDPDALGPCGCIDYHMSDCPLVSPPQLDPPEPDDD